jgi:hypothetical protein
VIKTTFASTTKNFRTYLPLVLSNAVCRESRGLSSPAFQLYTYNTDRHKSTIKLHRFTYSYTTLHVQTMPFGVNLSYVKTNINIISNLNNQVFSLFLINIAVLSVSTAQKHDFARTRIEKNQFNAADYDGLEVFVTRFVNFLTCPQGTSGGARINNKKSLTNFGHLMQDQTMTRCLPTFKVNYRYRPIYSAN